VSDPPVGSLRPPPGFRGVTFDLFETLVRLDEDRLPRIAVGGVSYASLLAAPLRVLTEQAPRVVLIDALIAYAEAVDETKRRFAVDSGPELPADWTFQRCLARLGVTDTDLAAALASSFMEATIAATQLEPDVPRVLEGLRRRGLSLALISNLADPVGGRTLLRRLGLDTCFDAVVFSGVVGWRKPDARIFHYAAEQLGQPPEALLHVGDEPRADVKGACRAGLGAIWINADGQPFEGDFPPLARIRRLADLAILMDISLDAPGEPPISQANLSVDFRAGLSNIGGSRTVVRNARCWSMSTTPPAA
jgi:putative hydrolase of the HAD superfamily